MRKETNGQRGGGGGADAAQRATCMRQRACRLTTSLARVRVVTAGCAMCHSTRSALVVLGEAIPRFCRSGEGQQGVGVKQLPAGEAALRGCSGPAPPTCPPTPAGLCRCSARAVKAARWHPRAPVQRGMCHMRCRPAHRLTAVFADGSLAAIRAEKQWAAEGVGRWWAAGSKVLLTLDAGRLPVCKLGSRRTRAPAPLTSAQCRPCTRGP